MGDVNSERARREARETVGSQRPSTGENRVQAAMRRYLGAEIFDELHPESSTEAATKAKPAVDELGRAPRSPARARARAADPGALARLAP